MSPFTCSMPSAHSLCCMRATSSSGIYHTFWDAPLLWKFHMNTTFYENLQPVKLEIVDMQLWHSFNNYVHVIYISKNYGIFLPAIISHWSKKCPRIWRSCIQTKRWLHAGTLISTRVLGLLPISAKMIPVK